MVGRRKEEGGSFSVLAGLAEVMKGSSSAQIGSGNKVHDRRWIGGIGECAVCLGDGLGRGNCSRDVMWGNCGED